MRGMSWRDGGRLRAPHQTDPEQASALQPAGQRAGSQIYLAFSLTSGRSNSGSNIVRRASRTWQLRPGYRFSPHVPEQHGRRKLLRIRSAVHQQQVRPAVAVEVRRQRLHRGVTAAESSLACHFPERTVALIMEQTRCGAIRRRLWLEKPACRLLQRGMRRDQQIRPAIAIVVKENGTVSLGAYAGQPGALSHVHKLASALVPKQAARTSPELHEHVRSAITVIVSYRAVHRRFGSDQPRGAGNIHKVRSGIAKETYRTAGSRRAHLQQVQPATAGEVAEAGTHSRALARQPHGGSHVHKGAVTLIMVKKVLPAAAPSRPHQVQIGTAVAAQVHPERLPDIVDACQASGESHINILACLPAIEGEIRSAHGQASMSVSCEIGPG